MVHKIAPWLLVVAWMGLIFSYSHAPAVESAAQSGVLARFVYYDVLRSSVFTMDQVHTFIRTSAHFFLYFILGVWFFNAMYSTTTNSTRLIVDTTLFGFVYGVFDEIHQYFVPGRAMTLFDVAIDTLGAMTASLVCLAIVKFKLKRL